METKLIKEKLKEKGYQYLKYSDLYGFIFAKHLINVDCNIYICIEKTGDLGDYMVDSETLAKEHFIFAQAEIDRYQIALNTVQNDMKELWKL